MTWLYRANAWTWAFQCREWMIDQVGSSKTAGWPAPKDS
jgi:hypothetical protein